MTSTLALLPSPFLGPAVWRPVLEALAALGQQAIVPSIASAAPRTPQDVLLGLVSALPDDQDLILVPHSNAGLYVPALAGQRRVHGYVFVDALLPDRSGSTAMAPPALLDILRPKAAADGMLPVWTSWWDDADVAGLFPRDTVRQEVEREQRRLPLSYLEGTLPVQAGWDDRPGAYLAFGDTYADARGQAARRRWPVATMPGAHLHMLIDPEQVAGRILDLAAAAGVGSGRR